MQVNDEVTPIIQVETAIKIDHPTIAELHCSKPYRERRVCKSIVFLVGTMMYLTTMAAFTIYNSRADFDCKQIYRLKKGSKYASTRVDDKLVV